MEKGQHRHNKALAEYLAALPTGVRRPAVEAALATLEDVECAIVDSGGNRMVLDALFEELYRMRDELARPARNRRLPPRRR